MIFSLYITAKDKKEAVNLVKHLLKNKLIACANIFPIESFYTWKGKFVEDKEYAIIAKTNKSFKLLEKEIIKVHSYELPCICKFNVQANKDFEEWVRKT
ncbi:MAG: divalent-cation tolerance protein CutA [Nanoarchaeota archaeon]|nr:divalent-cation tolerance protein CutA [Nanoarchaeota archaeon]